MKKLPKISQPLFEIVIPSLGKAFLFRPFLVKEEKILLTASADGSEKAIYTAISQVINNTCSEKINLDKLTSYDIEYIFTKLRARSVDNLLKFIYNDPEDNISYDLSYDLDELKPAEPKEVSSTILLDKEAGIGFQLRYPSWEEAISFRDSSLTRDQVIDSMLKVCIDTVFDSEEVYEFASYSDEEKTDYIDNLTVNSLEKANEFLTSLPVLEANIEYTRKDGSKNTINLLGISDFFSWG